MDKLIDMYLYLVGVGILFIALGGIAKVIVERELRKRGF